MQEKYIMTTNICEAVSRSASMVPLAVGKTEDLQRYLQVVQYVHDCKVKQF